ncbi:MAG: helix-turn-helix transcriptional regulator [Patescibacteria group bacterium]|nr:helix-turn-helix transcriptional regulator [Patescibacteria group bacterium]
MPRRNIKKNGHNPVDVFAGNRLQTRRKECGLSQEKLGDKVGLTFGQIQKYEYGLNRIPSDKLHQFCEILGVAVSYFFKSGRTTVGGGDIILGPEIPELAKHFMRIKVKERRDAVLALVEEIVDMW